jgi:Fe-S cluster assembly protein SufD
MTAAAEKFMAPAAQNAEALPWLDAAPQTDAPAWMKALRATGAEAFAATGLPTPVWEGWQHTNLRVLSQTKYRYSAAPVKFDAAKLPAPLLEGAQRIVVVNGQYQPYLSDTQPGVTVLSLMDAAMRPVFEQWIVSVGDLAQLPLKALNTAFLRDGFALKAEGDAARPVEVLFYNSGDAAAIYPRVLYWLAPNAGLTVLERHCGEGAYFANLAAEVVLERDARLRFTRLMQDGPEAVHTSHMAVQQHKNSDFEGFSLASGAKTAREEFKIDLIDSVIRTSIKGIYVLKDKQNHDFTVSVTHFEPEGKSGQYFKGVVDDQARAVFQGKIHVRRAAQKADGYQSHHALLLSRQAEACFKPELEIYADDVKCGHGATSGQLDPESLFYLQSRGIPREDAENLLIESFLTEAADGISFAPAREIVRDAVSRWLKERRAA